MAKHLISKHSFDFGVDNAGNHMAYVDGTDKSSTYVSIKTFCGKVFVDIRDFFMLMVSENVDTSNGGESITTSSNPITNGHKKLIPTKRGVTLTKEEWLALVKLGSEVCTILLNMYNKIQTDKTIKQVDFYSKTISEQLRLVVSLAPRVETAYEPVIRVNLIKKKASQGSGENLPETKIVLSPYAWKLITCTNNEQVTGLLNIAENDASLAAQILKETKRAEENKLWTSFMDLSMP